MHQCLHQCWTVTKLVATKSDRRRQGKTGFAMREKTNVGSAQWMECHPWYLWCVGLVENWPIWTSAKAPVNTTQEIRVVLQLQLCYIDLPLSSYHIFLSFQDGWKWPKLFFNVNSFIVTVFVKFLPSLGLTTVLKWHWLAILLGDQCAQMPSKWSLKRCHRAWSTLTGNV